MRKTPFQSLVALFLVPCLCTDPVFVHAGTSPNPSQGNRFEEQALAGRAQYFIHVLNDLTIGMRSTFRRARPPVEHIPSPQSHVTDPIRAFDVKATPLQSEVDSYFPDKLGSMAMQYHGYFKEFGRPSDQLDSTHAFHALKIVKDPFNKTTHDHIFKSGFLVFADDPDRQAAVRDLWVVKKLSSAPAYTLSRRDKHGNSVSDTWVVGAVAKAGSPQGTRVYYVHKGTGLCVSACVNTIRLDFERSVLLAKEIEEQFRRKVAMGDPLGALAQARQRLAGIYEGIRDGVIAGVVHNLGPLLTSAMIDTLYVDFEMTAAEMARAFRQKRDRLPSPYGELEALATVRQLLSDVDSEKREVLIQSILKELGGEASPRVRQELNRPFNTMTNNLQEKDRNIFENWAKLPIIPLLLKAVQVNVLRHHQSTASHLQVLKDLAGIWAGDVSAPESEEVIKRKPYWVDPDSISYVLPILAFKPISAGLEPQASVAVVDMWDSLDRFINVQEAKKPIAITPRHIPWILAPFYRWWNTHVENAYMGNASTFSNIVRDIDFGFQVRHFQRSA